jgi:CheY-like chemotaxis protein
MTEIKDAFESAPLAFAWPPQDVALPEAFSGIPGILASFSLAHGLTIFPWYHDLPIWHLTRTDAQSRLEAGIQVGFGGLRGWPLPGLEQRNSTSCLSLAGWISDDQLRNSVAPTVLEGSQLTLTLVLSQLESIWRAVEIEMQANKALPQAGHILIVDDDTLVRETLAQSLINEGYRVETVDTAVGALAAIDRERPDLIIVDASSPAIRGWTLAREVRARGIEIPLVVVTANPAVENQAEQLGAAAVVTKPISLASLLSSLDRLSA